MSTITSAPAKAAPCFSAEQLEVFSLFLCDMCVLGPFQAAEGSNTA